MSNFRGSWFWVCVIVAAWSAPAHGQEPESADALLTRAHATLTGLPYLEVTAVSRDLHATRTGGPRAAGEGGFRVMTIAYQQTRVTRRQPDDWRLVIQREREVNKQLTPERKLVFAKVGQGDASVMLLNAMTKETSQITIPAALFRQELLERGGAGLREDAVLGALVFNRSEVGAAAFGLENVSRAGVEETNGVRLVRLVGTSRRNKVTLWIDEATGLVARSLVSPEERGYTPFLQLKETLYAYDLLRGSESSDYDLEEGWAKATSGFPTTSGFVALNEVLALAGAKSAPEQAPVVPKPGDTPRASDPFAPPVAASPGAPAAPSVAPTTAPAAEEQLLTPQQMEAIVLVEGDDGVGSGFVARIRDVDFVVTNQHVIGGNDKVRVTTVRGVPVKVGAIFGAMGRDIAILRIEGENTVPALKISEDPVKTAKLGDKVAVVGNRRGGGVATQVSGVVRGIGPDKIEVDAPFQPGNSGSPIVHVASGEVIGLATYSLTRRLDVLDGPAGKTATKADGEPATEQRWFGHRADGVARWEAIDQAKWRAQAKRVTDFYEDSAAIYYAMNGRFKEASGNPRVRLVIDRFEERVDRMGATQTVVAQEVQEFFRGLRALAESGTKDLRTGDYYDYFRTNMYWETSITEQLRAREDLARRLDKASENTAAFLAKLRR